MMRVSHLSKYCLSIAKTLIQAFHRDCESSHLPKYWLSFAKTLIQAFSYRLEAFSLRVWKEDLLKSLRLCMVTSVEPTQQFQCL